MNPTYTTTTAANLTAGDAFHLAGRRGMSDVRHVAQLVARENARTVVVVEDDETVNRLSPNAKVWVEND